MKWEEEGERPTTLSEADVESNGGWGRSTGQRAEDSGPVPIQPQGPSPQTPRSSHTFHRLTPAVAAAAEREITASNPSFPLLPIIPQFQSV